MSELFIAHSAKGTSWKNHKYISKKNGKYTYNVPSIKPDTTSNVIPENTSDAWEIQLKPGEYNSPDDINRYYDYQNQQLENQRKWFEDYAQGTDGYDESIKKINDDIAWNEFRRKAYLKEAEDYEKEHPNVSKKKAYPTKEFSHSDYLVHHGILGMKWGRKNGPPYPLDFKDLSAEEREKAKADSIRDGDIKTAQKNKSYYTRNELEEVINRFNTNQRLTELNAKQVKTGMDKVDAVSKKIGTISNLTQNVSNFVQNGTNLYNNVAKVTNSLGLTDAKIIGEKKPKTSYKEKDLEKILKNIDDYSDEDVRQIKQRADNIDQLRKKKFRSNNDD